MIQFKKILKDLRQQHGLSQAQLAEKIGYSQNHISKIEAGILNPSIKFLEKLFNTLNIEATSFFSELTHQSQDPQTNALKADILHKLSYFDTQQLTLINQMIDLLHTQFNSSQSKPTQ